MSWWLFRTKFGFLPKYKLKRCQIVDCYSSRGLQCSRHLAVKRYLILRRTLHLLLEVRENRFFNPWTSTVFNWALISLICSNLRAAKVKNFFEVIWDLNSYLSVADIKKSILHKVCLISNMLQPDMFYMWRSFLWQKNDVSLFIKF